MISKLQRKDYVLTISIKKKFLGFSREKKVTCRYKQASLYETVRFMDILKGNKPLHVRLIEFIENTAKIKLSVDEQLFVSSNIDKFLSEVMDTYFCGCFGKRETSQNDNSPFSSFLSLVVKELKVDPNILLHEYTMQQINYLMDGVVWNYNEQTEEGKRRNRLKAKESEFENRTEDDKRRDEEFFNS